MKVKKENRKNKGEVKLTKKWCIGDYCLFKVGFNQLINELSFMHHWDFVLAISRIENTHMNKHSSNQLMTLSVGMYVTYIWTSPYPIRASMPLVGPPLSSLNVRTLWITQAYYSCYEQSYSSWN